MINVDEAVKAALKAGNLRKNHRIIVLDVDGAEDFTIENDHLVAESITYNEMMCTGDVLKFGLCEGTEMEFQYFGLPNISGRRINYIVDVEYRDGSIKSQSIPMGYFKVDECSRQASTGIMKVKATNSLKSAYFDAPGKEMLLDAVDNKNGQIIMRDIKNILLDGFEIADTAAEYVPVPVSSNYGMLAIYGTSFQFTNLRVDVSEHEQPFNAYAAGVTATTQNRFYCIWSDYFSAQLDPTKVYRFHAKHGYSMKLLDSVAETIKNYIADTLKNSKVSTTAGGVDNILRNGACNLYNVESNTQFGTGNGLAAAMYATVLFEDGHESLYSNIGFESGNASYAGTFRDLFGKTLIGAVSLNFVIPWRLGLTTAATNRANAHALVELNTFSDGFEVEYEYRNSGGSVVSSFYEVPYDAALGAHVPYNVLGRFMDMASVEGYTELDKHPVTISELPDFTLRDIASALFEPYAQFGRLNRVTDLFSGVTLSGHVDEVTPAMYSRLWADDGNIHRFRNLVITYKGLDEEGKEAALEYTTTINASGTDDYIMDSNWMFKEILWAEADIERYAQGMVDALRDVTWFPFEMWGAGLPYLETGDGLLINLNGQQYLTYILHRNLKGLQNLEDETMNGSLNIF